ncbi:MAG: hypothetical protein GYB65_11325, partial [Chloroflexi bacterium]|nr:hypothetical protein [Chloroflexota bacterium]
MRARFVFCACIVITLLGTSLLPGASSHVHAATPAVPITGVYAGVLPMTDRPYNSELLVWVDTAELSAGEIQT